jgi:hypothetical protein
VAEFTELRWITVATEPTLSHLSRLPSEQVDATTLPWLRSIHWKYCPTCAFGSALGTRLVPSRRLGITKVLILSGTQSPSRELVDLSVDFH